MAYDDGLAELMRGDLADLPGLTEKKMFGGLCFLQHGNMICGVHAGGAMFRVGKENEAQALALDGVGPMTFTGRKMGGMVDADDDAMADDRVRQDLIGLALGFVATLPPK
ncbi:TfoX/Sxy family protein [uncultured Roseovarius sp.]|uniref:TfoX/Sxy family protein n=1 Tax=uncultured Roseovarius sp. TaxID=293344 RepID=UPI002617EFE1|nr:TfoX/Sxy family protein [uncultured Roseovarius sp.]